MQILYNLYVILNKSDAIVRAFCEIMKQICVFQRPFHLCLTEFSCTTDVEPLHRIYGAHITYKICN